MDWTKILDRLFSFYYGVKFYPFRQERKARRQKNPLQGFVAIQIDGLSYPHLCQALQNGYMPHLSRHLQRGYALREYSAGLPSTTPAAQAFIFYGQSCGIPAFRWYEKDTGNLLSCNDPDHVQYFRERLFPAEGGLLQGGSSYSNILDGGAARSVFTVSSPHPQTLLGRFGGKRLLMLILLHPLRVLRMACATLLEYVTNLLDAWHFRKSRPWRLREGLFPFIRIFCNVILRELQTFGVIADIYAGVPVIYTTYSGYDELAHHFGPSSDPALKNLKYTDKRIGEIMRMLRHSPGGNYELIILSDHGQTEGFPFRDRYGATLGEAVSAFLRENESASVSGGPLDFTRVQLEFLEEEWLARPKSFRHRIYRRGKRFLQRRIREMVPETLKIDPEGGVVITYSSSLAHLYFTGEKRRLSARDVEEAAPLLLQFLRQHKGIGFVMVQGEREGEVCFYHRDGKRCLSSDSKPDPSTSEFLRIYGEPEELLPELLRFASGPFCGDLIIFGAYDGREIACFDDQVGGHGSIGGEQMQPFLILPAAHPLLKRERLSGYSFLYPELFKPLLPQAHITPSRQ